MSDPLENRVEKLESRMDRVERTLELASAITLNVAQARAEDEKAWKKSMEALKLSIAELNEGVTVLFHTVDEWIRNNPRSNGGPGSVQKS